MELRENERFFILAVRRFDFLRKLGYDYETFSIYSREPGLVFRNEKAKRRIIIGSYVEGLPVSVSIQKMQRFKNFMEWPAFEVARLPQVPGFGHVPDVRLAGEFEPLLNHLAGRIETFLMPVVEGIRWIEE